jgi:hypothetical protein
MKWKTFALFTIVFSIALVMILSTVRVSAHGGDPTPTGRTCDPTPTKRTCDPTKTPENTPTTIPTIENTPTTVPTVENTPTTVPTVENTPTTVPTVVPTTPTTVPTMNNTLTTVPNTPTNTPPEPKVPTPTEPSLGGTEQITANVDPTYFLIGSILLLILVAWKKLSVKIR